MLYSQFSIVQGRERLLYDALNTELNALKYEIKRKPWCPEFQPKTVRTAGDSYQHWLLTASKNLLCSKTPGKKNERKKKERERERGNKHLITQTCRQSGFAVVAYVATTTLWEISWLLTFVSLFKVRINNSEKFYLLSQLLLIQNFQES